MTERLLEARIEVTTDGARSEWGYANKSPYALKVFVGELEFLKQQVIRDLETLTNIEKTEIARTEDNDTPN